MTKLRRFRLWLDRLMFGSKLPLIEKQVSWEPPAAKSGLIDIPERSERPGGSVHFRRVA